MSTPTYTITPEAYYKLFFHAAKHPHKPVNGLLLGTQSSPTPGGAVVISDAVPLLHHWTSLSPMMEIGLDLATQYADEVGLRVVGYYQACERVDETALAPVGEKVASKIKAKFADAVAFVIDGEKFGSGEAALLPYTAISTSTSWRPTPSSHAAFTPGSEFQLSAPGIPEEAARLVREQHLQHAFGDFDDHLEDVTIDWLRNRACLP
ncbi:hypothetical protein B0H34DRAFT_463374 [Crassisporium funariophilum]|nr:hypothetical protein B0H34DRAFT_463374 [Crassisporium funariophilum]